MTHQNLVKAIAASFGRCRGIHPNVLEAQKPMERHTKLHWHLRHVLSEDVTKWKLSDEKPGSHSDAMQEEQRMVAATLSKSATIRS